ncbi:protein kinase family protein [Aspergillus foveolatus]|uniref:protein kinase family protein n=1 Tax=Aspergillus foveolatus TaxID=210207 RepID=UPI003CCD675D
MKLRNALLRGLLPLARFLQRLSNYVFRDPRRDRPDQPDTQAATPPLSTVDFPPPNDNAIKVHDNQEGNRSSESLKRLQRGLKDARINSTDRRGQFIPMPIVQRLVADNIETILMEKKILDAEYVALSVRNILQTAVKLFAILADLKSDKEKYIIQLLREKIGDEHLPFKQKSGLPRSGFYLVTRQGATIEALKDWDSKSTENFEIKQYRFLSPVFRRGEHYDLDDMHVLPFTKKVPSPSSKTFAKGGYGKVFQAHIHPGHHEIGDKSSQEPLAIAVKEMMYDDNFESELTVYRDLGPSNHPHIIDLLFSYRHDGNYHLVFPWANGSLKEYWVNGAVPTLDASTVKWSLSQMIGLTSGLTHFHEFKQQSTGEVRFGRHGDIKAANILYFQPSEGDAILKIADLGLASISSRNSRSNVDPKSIVPSITYAPPDVERKCDISRKWDIWSLGCLFLEFVTYLVLGGQAIDEFSEERKETTMEFPEFAPDFFYSKDHNSVKPCVFSWVDRLKKNPRCSHILSDILDLVITEMIIIEPRNRSSSLDIYNKLREFMSQGEEDEGYLLKPPPNPGITSAQTVQSHNFTHWNQRPAAP